MRLARLPIAVAALAALPRLTAAAPFDPHEVPADAKLVVHVDVDQGRDSAVGRAALDKLLAAPGVDELLKTAGAMGVTLPQDLHDVTIFTTTPTTPKTDFVMGVAHLDFDRAKVMAAVQQAGGGVMVRAIGGHDTVVSASPERTTCLALYDDHTVVVALTEPNLTHALAALDGKVPTAPADGVLSGVAPATTRPTVPPGGRPLVYLAVADLGGFLPRGQPLPPVFDQVVGLSMAATEVGPALDVRTNVVGKTAAAADQLRRSFDGVRAMLALTDDHGDRPLMTAKAAVRQLVLGRADRTVTADLSVPTVEVVDAIRSAAMTATAKPDANPGVSVSVSVQAGQPTTRPAAPPTGDR